MVSKAFQRWTGLSAMGLAVGGIAYSIAFLVFLNGGGRNAKIANSALLLVGGVVMTMVFVALYERLRVVDAAFALWGAIIGIAGAFASALHGGFDPAIAARRLPSPELSGIDPRGLGTFALTAIGVAVLSALMRDPAVFPTRLRYQLNQLVSCER